MTTQNLLSTASRTRPDAVVKPRRVSSGALLGGQRVVLIEHNGECYQLRHTLRGKLILTK